MKLSLDNLKIDSYASQLSETELVEVKGGTQSSAGCLSILYNEVSSWFSSDDDEGDTCIIYTNSKTEDGCTTTTTVVKSC